MTPRIQAATQFVGTAAVMAALATPQSTARPITQADISAAHEKPVLLRMDSPASEIQALSDSYMALNGNGLRVVMHDPKASGMQLQNDGG